MTDKYKLLRLDRNDRDSGYAVLVLTSGFQKQAETYDILMPNVGDYSNASKIIKMLKDEAEANRLRNEENAREREEHFKNPHVYAESSPITHLCYCGGLPKAGIHISEEDKDASTE